MVLKAVQFLSMCSRNCFLCKRWSKCGPWLRSVKIWLAEKEGKTSRWKGKLRGIAIN